MQQPIIVIGCHRSGTSLVSNILHQMGVWMGGVQDDNFEPYYFIIANERLLFHFGATWDNPLPFVERMQSPNDIALAIALLHNYPYQHRDFFNDYLGKEHRSLTDLPPKWGWKEPRTSITLPIWLHYFPEAKIIYVQRDGQKVAASMQKRHQDLLSVHYGGQIPETIPLNHLIHTQYTIHSHRPVILEEAHKIWEEYERTIAKWRGIMTNNLWLDVCYEALLEKPMVTLQEMQNFCGLQLSDSDLQKISTLITPSSS
jgi:hypothetical protein